MQKRLVEIKRRWGDNSGLGFLKGATIDAVHVCAYVCVRVSLSLSLCVWVRVYAWAACPFVYNACVCWAEEERRIWTRLLKPGSSGGHNRSRLTQRTGLQQVLRRGGGVGGPCEPSQPHGELEQHGDKHTISYVSSSETDFSLQSGLVCKRRHDAFSTNFSACK